MIKLCMELYGKHRYTDFIQPYKQLSKTSCSAASLHMTYKSLGFNLFEEGMMEQFDTEYRGYAEWEDLIRHPPTVGFTQFTFNDCRYDLLREIYEQYGFPTIILWSPNHNHEDVGHFSPIKIVNHEEITIADPYYGDMETLSRKSFIKVWRNDRILVVGPPNSILKL